MPRLASPCERLDDEHATAAAWAWTRERRRFGCVSRFEIVRNRVRLRNIQQGARFGDVVSAATVGQEPVVAGARGGSRPQGPQAGAGGDRVSAGAMACAGTSPVVGGAC